MKPKFIMRCSGEYLHPPIKTKRFKLHLKRNHKEGADTSNEAWCGFYPVGGNDGRLVEKGRLVDVDCKKCLQIYKYYQKKWKKRLPFQGTGVRHG